MVDGIREETEQMTPPSKRRETFSWGQLIHYWCVNGFTYFVP